MSPNYIIWDNEHKSDIIVEEIRVICQSTLNCAFYQPPIGFYSVDGFGPPMINSAIKWPEKFLRRKLKNNPILIVSRNRFNQHSKFHYFSFSLYWQFHNIIFKESKRSLSIIYRHLLQQLQ